MKIVPKQRIGYMDIAKGICIMLIVLFHIWTNSGKINTIVISFHVPLFFFISGAFFKMYDNFGIFIKKKINTILIPYIIFYLLFRFAYSIVMLNIFGQEAPNPNWNHLWLWFHGEGVGGPIWFLRCLFWINLYYYAIVSVCKNNQFAIAACSLLLGIMGFVMGYYAFALPLHLDTGMTAMPFFSAGHFLFANAELFKENKYDKYIYPLILSLCIVLYLTACGPSYLFNKFDTTIFIGCSFLKTYISGFAGVLCLMGGAKLMQNNFLLSYIGRNSLIILCTHRFIYTIVYGILLEFEVHNYITILVFILTMLCYGIVIPVMNNYCPYIVGRKPVLK